MERLQRLLRSYANWLALVVGCLLVFIGRSLAESYPAFETVLLAVGGSVIGTTIFTFIFFKREDLAQLVIDSGILRIFHNRKEAFTNDDWFNYLKNARAHFRVLGVANHGYLQELEHQRCAEAFRSSINEHYVSIEILWLKPDSALAEARDNEEERATRRDTIDSIIWFWGLKKELSPHLQEKMVLKEYDLTPTCGITWIDHHLIITHYLPVALNLTAPGFVLEDDAVGRLLRLLRGERPLAQKYQNVYSRISETAIAISQERIDKLKEVRKTLSVTEPSEEKFRREGSKGKA